jgi:tyrosyl-DNA phosphodiesterase 2
MRTETFSVLTYNVWFSLLACESRALAVLEYVREHDPDVVAFQEVTARFMLFVQESVMVRERYYLSERDYHGNYGTLLMCKRRPRAFLCYDRFTTSSQGRDLLVATYRTSANRKVLLSTVHLESTRPRAIHRALQLDASFHVLAKAQSAVFVGDMNMDPGSAENESVPDDVLDVWPHLHPAQIGYTEDSHVNHMRYLAKHEHGQRRIDRVFVRGDHLTPTHIQILGDHSIAEEHLLEKDRGQPDPVTGQPMSIYPSDHQGLFAVFSLSPL